MKKSYLMIAAAAALFAACSSNDTLKEFNKTEGPAINFSSYTQKISRAENSSASYSLFLEDHHSSFKVWGFKNTSATAVFFNETVSYNNNSTTDDTSDDYWSYNNTRYWDKTATDYYFYACAPSTSALTFNGATSAAKDAADNNKATAIASQPNGYFTITSDYSQVGQNISPKNSTSKQESWKGKTDIDLMIAAPKHLTGNALNYSTVQLKFIHILSRLNVTIKTADTFYPTVNDGDKIVVNNITIGKMKTTGKFSENNTVNNGGANGTPIDANEDGQINAADNAFILENGTYKRWITSTDGSYSFDINYDATQAANYVVEALMLPQILETEEIEPDGSSTETKPYLYINYSIFNNDKDAESEQVYEAFYNLATILTKKTNPVVAAHNTAFNEGWQNTINITINPDKIIFDADVAAWSDTNTNDLEVK